MSTQAKGTYEVKNWDEKPYDEWGNGAKLTRADVTQTFKGDIEGEGSVEFLMMYPNEKYASYVGMQRVVGSIGDRAGSFVLQTTGTFEGGEVKGTWFVVEGSGTEELRGLKGEGSFAAKHGENAASFILDYSFEQ